MMISGSDDKTLRFWNMTTYQCETVIKGVGCCSTISLYQIDKDRVIVGGFETFCIANIDKCVIERTIEDKALGGVNCIIKLRDGNTIIWGCNDNNFCFFDMNNKYIKLLIIGIKII